MSDKLKQFIMYSGFGLTAFVVDLLTLKTILATAPFIWYPLVVGFSYWFASSLHYLANWKWTFAGAQINFWSAYARYLSVNIFSIILLSVLTFLVVEFLYPDVLIARVLCGGIVSIIAFLLQRRFSFKVR